jgi:hypothetical protein
MLSSKGAPITPFDNVPVIASGAGVTVSMADSVTGADAPEEQLKV